MSFFVYILKCADGTLYVGSTNDLEKRLHAHNNLKSGAHYTKIRRPVTLAYSETCETFAESRRKEAEFKRLSRPEKLSLIKNSQKKKQTKTTKKIIPKKSSKKSKTK
jgi:putative endonuclease